jgi:hypothetical protein
MLVLLMGVSVDILLKMWQHNAYFFTFSYGWKLAVTETCNISSEDVSSEFTFSVKVK